MKKIFHEIRDPIHIFIKINNRERKVINSEPFQRLRFIHQLATTYLIYPGATHRRFEHSLGVMELASKVYDVVTNENNIRDEIRNQIPQITEKDYLKYWRNVLRMAALCHDMGHLPFSHAAEKELLPAGWNHEKLTRELIQSEYLLSLWDESPPIKAEDIIKLAVGPKVATDLEFTLWETILSEIITSDCFGADRIDYLLRDSLHTGVAYGKFDHYRLIDTLRILPSPKQDNTHEIEKSEPTLGIEAGGIHAAEALLLARYFMYTQVYFHPVRRIYDIHLMDFLKDWLPEGKFSTDLRDHLSLTDCEVIKAMRENSRKKGLPGHKHADILINRKHYKLLYERNPVDISERFNAPELIYNVIKSEYGSENVKYDGYLAKGGVLDFPILTNDEEIMHSTQLSKTLRDFPKFAIAYIFINECYRKKAKELLQTKKVDILKGKDREEL
jgi:uncharacterized protein